MALKGKMQAYAEARAQGLEPLGAAAQAGYSGAGVRVTATRLEQRDDMKAEIKRLRKGGAPASKGGDEHMPEKWAMKDRYQSPLALLEDVWNNPDAPKSLRYQAAKDALPYCHARKEGGKKEEAADKSKKAAKGKFGTARRPSHLSVVK